MAAKKPAKQSLLEQAKTLAPKRGKTWLDSLPEQQRIEVIELLNAIITGEVDVSHNAATDLMTANGIPATRNKIADALRKMRQERAR